LFGQTLPLEFDALPQTTTISLASSLISLMPPHARPAHTSACNLHLLRRQAKKLGDLLKQAQQDNNSLKGRLGLGGPGHARSMSPMGPAAAANRGGHVVGGCCRIIMMTAG
jgi:hypothetical protein